MKAWENICTQLNWPQLKHLSIVFFPLIHQLELHTRSCNMIKVINFQLTLIDLERDLYWEIVKRNTSFYCTKEFFDRFGRCIYARYNLDNFVRSFWIFESFNSNMGNRISWNGTLVKCVLGKQCDWDNIMIASFPTSPFKIKESANNIIMELC